MPTLSGGTAKHVAARRGHGPLFATLLRVISDPGGAFGMTVLGVLMLTALFAPVLAPYEPRAQHPGLELVGPGTNGFLLGTDQFGRDLLTRTMWGARVSLTVALLAVGVGGAAGVATGLFAGYLGGVVDAVVMRLYDVVLSFPGILPAIAIVGVVGPGSINVAWALAIGLMPTFARLTRSSVLRERESDYVAAARATGASDWRIIWTHIFPNSVAPILVQLSVALGFAVLAESGLSFLGLGTQPPDPSWGGMLSDSRGFLREAPWYGIWPGLALASLVLGLNTLSDAMRDALDPRTSAHS